MGDLVAWVPCWIEGDVGGAIMNTHMNDLVLALEGDGKIEVDRVIDESLLFTVEQRGYQLDLEVDADLMYLCLLIKYDMRPYASLNVADVVRPIADRMKLVKIEVDGDACIVSAQGYYASMQSFIPVLGQWLGCLRVCERLMFCACDLSMKLKHVPSVTCIGNDVVN